ncbi:hypothetical protein Gotri_008279 [Gossypium trilobum]|uniref:Uncharacterized protein n=1 Tax=Gossypium trilobum TaxID=34281 RepID=A0A7J9EIY2_9ROSI|nr:hypothetical protein [Gossypium trilobum]
MMNLVSLPLRLPQLILKEGPKRLIWCENPNYDSFEFGFVNNFNDGAVAYDALFEYSDVYYDSSEISGQLWRPETLSAE